MAKHHRICSVEDCGNRVVGRGLCDNHYRKARRAEKKALGISRASPKGCSIQGCEKPHFALGLCLAHYTRKRRHGDPLGGGTSRGEPARWLLEHTSHQGESCLLWPYARGSGGDALVTSGGKQVSAAAEMCRLVYGAPPTPKHECAHNCGNGHLGCMNPSHLRWATRTENHLDKNLHGTMQRGERHYGSILTEDQVRLIRSSSKSGRSLAEEFGVDPGTIYAVRKKRTWAWLSD